MEEDVPRLSEAIEASPDKLRPSPRPRNPGVEEGVERIASLSGAARLVRLKAYFNRIDH